MKVDPIKEALALLNGETITESGSPDLAVARREITRLAGLDKVAYELEREATAKRLGMRVSKLDDSVAKARNRTAPSVPPISIPGMVMDRKGRWPEWCAENCGLALEHHPDWNGSLAYDEFNGLVMLLKPIPGSSTPRANFLPRPLTDHDITAAHRWFVDIFTRAPPAAIVVT